MFRHYFQASEVLATCVHSVYKIQLVLGKMEDTGGKTQETKVTRLMYLPSLPKDEVSFRYFHMTNLGFCGLWYEKAVQRIDDSNL